MRHDHEVMRICARGYLAHVRALRATLRAAEGDLEEARARLELMGASPDGGGSRGPARDRMADGVAKMEELRRRYAEEFARCADEVARAKAMCRPHFGSRHMAWLHDVERLTWAEVAGRTGYSERSARRIAEQGYEQVYALMPERWRSRPIPDAVPWEDGRPCPPDAW